MCIPRRNPFSRRRGERLRTAGSAPSPPASLSQCAPNGEILAGRPAPGGNVTSEWSDADGDVGAPRDGCGGLFAIEMTTRAAGAGRAFGIEISATAGLTRGGSKEGRYSRPGVPRPGSVSSSPNRGKLRGLYTKAYAVL
jgi:hypothetical protein